ncbi:MAG: ABC-type sugar transport system, periplasmic component [Candidatus Accumulibacter regalis]|jgi:predicted nucleotide-binding protein|uniref:ABC-type sugar transport system, periplasmic component n=1 Tax=Accumulibacter regalis TaxID=522306 RepID=A0A011PDC7_ACCRE|nr:MULTISPECIES: nucleotide-binding protein [unclassified Candidatus Accumulibacter]EXI85596.1 MAG: ABC-type sugar transport system, periplasmic component [Candidatus Accumulibacter regalis]MBN8513537.1 nucleotide-binding protein [Accumulibacter sp.]MBO3701801.1 nucleotide-binding protein [Accumulibacter sp.]HRE72606.1 nucleotide-binding protein [Accumulibacter sp.]
MENNNVLKRLADFVEHGWNLEEHESYDVWLRRIDGLLRSLGKNDVADELSALGRTSSGVSWKIYRDRQVSHLEGHVLLAEEALSAESKTGQLSTNNVPRQVSKTKVFVVHGHDDYAKQSAARFLEKLHLEAVLLHEKANQGQTVIEKFESYSDVGFAVVLLTPDDVGASSRTPEKLSGRARQNVILELGYFTGKLGRSRVCGLFRPGVEVPSDFHGVLFIEMDEQGGWKPKLAQELVSAGMQINVQGLLQG